MQPPVVEQRPDKSQNQFAIRFLTDPFVVTVIPDAKRQYPEGRPPDAIALQNVLRVMGGNEDLSDSNGGKNATVSG